MPLDLVKLKKLILVMLSADQAGEIAAASHAITKALKADGKDIHWLADKLAFGSSTPPPPPFYSPPPPPPQPAVREFWQEDLDLCADNIHQLRPREAEFIESLVDQQFRRAGWYPSPKQADWLEAIARRLKDYGAS